MRHRLTLRSPPSHDDRLGEKRLNNLWVGWWLIFGLAWMARSYHLGAVGLSEDEGYTLIWSKIGWLAENRLVPMPIHFFVTRLSTWLFGDSLLGARLLPFGFAILSLPLIYHIGRRLGGQETGWFATVLLAFHPLHIYYSQSCRYQGVAIFFCLLNIWSWLYLQEKPQLKRWGLWGVTWMLGALTFTPLILLGLLVLPLLNRKLRLAFLAVMAVALVPVMRWWLSIPKHYYAVGWIQTALGSLLKIEPVVAALVFCRTDLWTHLWRRKSATNPQQTLFYLVIFSLLLFSLLSFAGFVSSRYLLWQLPIWILLAATTIRHWPRESGALLILAAFLPNLFHYYANGGFGREGHRRALNYVAQARTDSERVMVIEAASNLFMLPASLPKEAVELINLPVAWDKQPLSTSAIWVILFSDYHQVLNAAQNSFLEKQCQLRDRLASPAQYSYKWFEIYRCHRAN